VPTAKFKIAFSPLCIRTFGTACKTTAVEDAPAGMLKHALDMNLKEYIHKAVGLCGVSAGRRPHDRKF